MPLSPGVTFGPYQIQSRLGSGGMGEVYLALDVRLRRPVALKLLLPEFTTSEEHLRRFEKEARAASALNHPNILTIHEIGRVESTSFIAAEFVEGDTLRSRMRRSSAFTLGEVIEIAAQVAEGLAAAHGAGVLHRDIKPENVMLRPDGYVKLVDFGLAKLSEDPVGLSAAGRDESTVSVMYSNSGSIAGTIKYMSPEQLRAAKLDARTDVWSLGCVLYEMLTGHPPFKGDSTAEIIVSILQKEAPRLGPEFPSELASIVEKSLSKDPNQRYVTAKDVAIKLRNLQRLIDVKDRTVLVANEAGDDRSVRKLLEVAPPETGTETPNARDTARQNQLTQFVKRNRSLVLSAVIAPVVIGVGLLIAYWFSDQRRAIAPVRAVAVTKLVDTGNTIDAVISPDGKYVAYVIEEPSGQSLWGRQVGAVSNSWPIVARSAQRFSGLTFSPDGNYIFFVVFDESINQYVLYRTPALGGVTEKVLEDVDTPVTFSPDGSRLAFVRGYPARGETAIVIAGVDGKESRVLATRKSPDDFGWKGGPSWSRDGQLIACAVGQYEAGMHVVAVKVQDGSQVRISSRDWPWIGRVTWLGGGDGLLMTAKETTSAPPQIWHIAYPGGEAQRITSDVSAYNHKGLSLTSDSSNAVAVQAHYLASIWISPIGQTGAPRRLSAAKSDGYNGLSWMPDGRIVFASSASGSQDIWVMDADGNHRKQLTSGGSANYQPTATPDGLYIVFVSTRAGGQDIWRMKVDGSDLRQLTFGAGADRPNCSPDSRWVVYKSYSSGTKTVWKIPIDGGNPVSLTDRYSDWPIFSPDGKTIVCEYWDQLPTTQAVIAIISTDGGAPTTTFKFLPVTATALDHANNVIRWAPGGRALTYIDGRSSVSNLVNQPVDGTPPKPLTSFESDHIFWFDWSRDGQSLVLSRGLVTTDVVLLKIARE